jgi:hypothetical protein
VAYLLQQQVGTLQAEQQLHKAQQQQQVHLVHQQQAPFALPSAASRS